MSIIDAAKGVTEVPGCPKSIEVIDTPSLPALADEPLPVQFCPESLEPVSPLN